MRQKKKRGRIQKPSPAAEVMNQNKKSERKTKTSSKTIKTTRNFRYPRSSHQTSEPLQTIKKHTEITVTTRVRKKPTFSLQSKHKTQTVKKVSTEPIKTTRNSKQQRLSHQRNQIEQKKKKRAEINSNRRSQPPRLLRQKSSLKKIANNVKVRSKTVRKSKKPSPVPSISDTCETETSQEDPTISKSPSISTSKSKEVRSCIPSENFTFSHISSVSRTEINEEGRYVSRATLTSISSSVASATENRENGGMSPEFVASTSSPTSISPAGFDRNLEPLKIVHMVEVHEQLFFMMMWKGSEVMDLVPVKDAKERCPQLVIQFYESRLKNVYSSSTRTNT